MNRISMLRGLVTGTVALGALLACAFDAQAGLVSIDFRGPPNSPTVGPNDLVITETTADGVTWTATGQQFLSGVWSNQAINRDVNGLGVLPITNHTNSDLDGIGFPERVGLFFSPTLVINSITFNRVDSNQGGDQFTLWYNGGQTGVLSISALGTGDGITFDLTTLGLTAAQRTGGQFYIGSTDGNDDVKIAGVQVVTAVPLPPAGWMGLGLLGGLAIFTTVRRRRAAVSF